MDNETIEIIEEHFFYTPDNFLHLLLDDPVHREEVDRNPAIFQNKKIMMKSYDYNKTLLLKYGDLLKNIEIEVCHYNSIEFIHQLLYSVPNVENLVISNDHRTFRRFYFDILTKPINLINNPIRKSQLLLQDIVWDYSHYLSNKLHFQQLKVLEFRRNSFGQETYSQLLLLLMNADKLDKLSIYIPSKADVNVIKDFLYNQKMLTVLELSGFHHNELFDGDIPNVSFRLKVLKIYGKLKNFEGFSNFIKNQDEIEIMILPCQNSSTLDVTLRCLKKMKKISISTSEIQRDTDYHQKFKRERYELTQLEDLRINNHDEEKFPLSDVLKMCPNVKIINIRSLKIEHGSGFSSLNNLEYLTVDSFNPLTLFNVKIENLKHFCCNKTTFYSNGLFWEHFLKNHPKLQTIAITFQHISIKSITEELLGIVESLQYLEHFTNFFFVSETRKQTRSVPFLNDIPEQTIEVGIFPNERIIRYNFGFQFNCAEALTIIADTYATYELVCEPEYFRIIRHLRHLMHL